MYLTKFEKFLDRKLPDDHWNFKEDIYYDKNDWKDKLIHSIKLYDKPQIIYLSDFYKGYY